LAPDPASAVSDDAGGCAGFGGALSGFLSASFGSWIFGVSTTFSGGGGGGGGGGGVGGGGSVIRVTVWIACRSVVDMPSKMK
jgi:hypothetical protein